MILFLSTLTSSGAKIHFFYDFGVVLGLFEYDFFGVSEVVVSGDEDAVSGLESVEYFVLTGVLPSDDDGCFACVGSGGVQFEYPLSAGGLEEVAFGYDDGVFGLFEFDLEAVAFADACVVDGFLGEDEVCFEVSFADFGVDFGDGEGVFFVLVGDCGGESGGDSVDVVFADACVDFDLVDDFEFTDAVSGGYFFSGYDADVA